MRRAFLTHPEAWTRASRAASDPVDYACAIKGIDHPWDIRGALLPAVLLVALIVIGVCLARALVPLGA